MTEIVSERDCLGQIFLKPKTACDRTAELRDFEAVSEASAKQVAFVIDEYLRLVFEPAERRRMSDAIADTLELSSSVRRGLCVSTAATRRSDDGVGCDVQFTHAHSVDRAHRRARPRAAGR